MTSDAYRSLFVSASDGLRLHARDYGPPASPALPVLCLPGLARHAEDFHDLAVALASDPARPRRVLALDYRGRGGSEHDPDWRRYDVQVETADVQQVAIAAGIAEAVVVGTSRGGLIAMALSAVRPTLLRGVVLNDIGPVIEARGLERIRGYVGKLPTPRSFAEGAAMLAAAGRAQFPHLSDEDWLAQARGTWLERDGGLALAYDPALAKTLAGLDLDAPVPSLWPLFAGLKGIPVMVLRGENSDILSAETLAAMAAAHPGLEAVTIPDQGHAPLLRGPDIIGRIARFVAAVETGRATPA